MPESFPDVFCLSADFSCRSFDKQPYINSILESIPILETEGILMKGTLS